MILQFIKIHPGSHYGDFLLDITFGLAPFGLDDPASMAVIDFGINRSHN
jgi:hypothetical protein